MKDFTTLQVVWFVLIGVLWIGYLVLEGFDFGVGMLIRAVAKDDTEKRMVLHSIGPFWDGNEVWLLTAGGATFAAFPEWYATLFSGAYLALFLVLAGLIVRGVSFEFWGKDDRPGWRATWEWALIVGSAIPALLWGVAWANIVSGMPIGPDKEFTGNLFDLLGPYALLGGLTTLLLFLAHGAVFLSLRTDGAVHDRADALARRFMPGAAVVTIAFFIWTLINQADSGGVEWFAALCAVISSAGVLVAVVFVRRSTAVTFGFTAAAIAFWVIAVFADLFPNVLVSSTNSAYDITLNAAASTNYTLKVMTVVAVLFVPIVLLYQGWTYWVFRARLSREDFEDIPKPFGLDRSQAAGTGSDDKQDPNPAGA